MTHITPNFSWDELNPHKLPLSAAVKKQLDLLANRLQVLRDLTGKPIRITSGYRDSLGNANAGGSADSRHLYGQAVDIDKQDIPPWLFALLYKNWAGGMGVYKTHIHLDIWVPPNGAYRRWNG